VRNTEPQLFSFQIRPKIPAALARLEDIAGDLWFSWHARARNLFRQMDEDLWSLCGHNPRLFLRRVSQVRLEEMANDRAFLSLYHGALADFDSYLKEELLWFPAHFKDGKQHAIAYFSAEFGLHESLPIYSGGLGILAGDHCKSASDLGLPFIAVGLLYRNGYFIQSIDVHGNQIATYQDNRFEDLCIEPLKGGDGADLVVDMELPGRQLHLKVWEAKVGHIRMLLLDADIDANRSEDRGITHQLYGGGLENRIQQEMCLGIGGVRALRAVGVEPTAWHANEGHAAFIVLERAREYVQSQGLTFDQAIEAVSASTVFTTHTPVPAGHDIFPLDLFDQYMGHYAEALAIPRESLHQLGRGDFGHGSGGFNQTALAIHGTSYQNGVSRLHGTVSSEMCHDMWPDIDPEENPVTSVTNGVHVKTWLAQEWIAAFDQELGARWRGRLQDPEFWESIHEIPDHLFWSIHQTNKQRMLHYIRERLLYQAKRNGESGELVRQMTADFDVRTLVIGFARRFATYKRATLLFHDEGRLKRLLDEVGKPVIFLFAGKAHPADEPGQALIRRIHNIARKPEFMGRVLMLEGYDMTLSRYMLCGVDVWMNNPRRPMEASGTSGMKAAMNGAPNLSVLDGWWPEGFQGDNGWIIGGERDIGDEQLRDAEDADSLYHVLQHDVIPTYYQLSERGFSDKWVYISKRAMIASIPYFNTDRMVAEYVERFYVPASRRSREMAADGFARAKALAAWKARVRAAWPQTSLAQTSEIPPYSIWNVGEDIPLRIKANLAGLVPEDVRVEVLFFRPARNGDYRRDGVIELMYENDGIYAANIRPDDTGNYRFQVRMYPRHPDLPHPMAMGLMTTL
jgi:starch phosphorylase